MGRIPARVPARCRRFKQIGQRMRAKISGDRQTYSNDVIFASSSLSAWVSICE